MSRTFNVLSLNSSLFETALPMRKCLVNSLGLAPGMSNVYKDRSTLLADDKFRIGRIPFSSALVPKYRFGEAPSISLVIRISRLES
jgi:hypothetical protein